jgi:hypothetical protein
MSQVKVFDTWVEGKHRTLHFDVMVRNDVMDAHKLAIQLTEEYLASIGEEGKVASEECVFCHVQPVIDPSALKMLAEKGGFVVPLN